MRPPVSPIYLLVLILLSAQTLAFSAEKTDSPPPTSEGWFDRPMRWAQLTLVENDPQQYDPDFWLDYFKRTHSDAACLSAGGCVAYYPTEIPLHHRSEWMKDSDPFGELLAGCRKMGMVVIARTDPHAVHQDVFDAHPDWIAVDENGNKRRHWSSPDMWVTCALGPYNFEFMTEVHKEIMSRYMVDGIFSNRWSGSGLCYCQHCQTNFKEYCGLELPRTKDPLLPEMKNYIVWRQKKLFDLWQLWDAEIRKINPNARYIPNSGGGALTSLDMKTIGQLADILFSDKQARQGVAPPWVNGKRGKEFRATMGQKPIGGIFSMGLEEPYRWKDSVQTEAEIRIYVADGIANGLRPWFTKFSGYLYDTRWLDVVEDIYNWHFKNEKYLRNETSLARVALVYSQQTAAFYGGTKAREKVQDHLLGMYHALIEARIPFEMVHDGLLEPKYIDRFKTLIFPNIAALSDLQCKQIRDYVTRGGSIIATYETSLYDQWGHRRPDFGLADLFGVKFNGSIQGPMKNSYLKIEKNPDSSFHPVLKDLENTSRIVNGIYRLDVTPTEKFPNPPITLIPPYPDLPMEKVYPRQPQTDIPEIYLRQIGTSRIVYLPWDIDRSFWEIMNYDHGRLLRNAVTWATNEQPPVTVTGPGVLDVTIWQQKNSLTVHLVNLTNPMMMKGPYRELIPVGPQKVSIALPMGKELKNIKLLKSGKTPYAEKKGSRLTVTVPSILDHEVIAINF
ncbi:MAG: alpha-amylase family protein [Planctomycetota bacterium]|jgi:hypothetical protein